MMRSRYSSQQSRIRRRMQTSVANVEKPHENVIFFHFFASLSFSLYLTLFLPLFHFCLVNGSVGSARALCANVSFMTSCNFIAIHYRLKQLHARIQYAVFNVAFNGGRSTDCNVDDKDRVMLSD